MGKVINRLQKILSLVLVTVTVAGVLTACKTPEEPAETPDIQGTAAPPPAPDNNAGEAVIPHCNCQVPPEITAPCDVPVPAVRNSQTPRDTFVAGTPPMRGDFIAGWGSNPYDLSVKTLTGGYRDTYYTDSAGKTLLNGSVVCNVSTQHDYEGNKTFTFSLHNYLKWNNGEPITAGDYVAGILAYASPAFAACGGISSAGEGLKGYEQYRQGGDGAYFEGIRLLDEFTFSATVDAGWLPYFWETSLLTFRPIYMAGWFPSNEIVSDEYGSRFVIPIAGDLQRISETERYAPAVTCGPYNFVSFEEGVVTLRRNEHFGVCAEGFAPYFENIALTEIIDGTGIHLLAGGEIDYLASVDISDIDYDAEIETGGEDGGSGNLQAGDIIRLVEYMRAGYGFIEFALDFGPTEDNNVRLAIAHLIDRSVIIDRALGGCGVTVDAAYSPEQWTYRERRGELEQLLTAFVYNPARADELLNETRWVYQSDGKTPFDPQLAKTDGSYLRHDEDGNALRVILAVSSEAVGEAIRAAAFETMPLAGMVLEIEVIKTAGLLDHYYNAKTFRDSRRKYHALQLAVDFTPIDDKYWSYHSNLADTYLNSNGVRDDELDRLTAEMRSLDSTQADEYADLWVEFQVRWQQLLPALPLYANRYFDAYNNAVTQVPVTGYARWHDVIMHVAKH